MSDNHTEAPVLVETITCANGQQVGVLTLNAPKSINSLTRTMVDILLDQLQRWATDEQIVCVLLRGSGDKGFCAGGDVVALRDSSIARDGAAEAFFAQEYRLDYTIHRYEKPIVAWGHGIVMGGGLGLLAGASHRVVTAKTRLAMPEVTIGLFPDVGGSWFLNQMPGRTGLFLALTGASIFAGDTLYVDIADYYLAHDQWAQLLEAFAKTDWGEAQSVHGRVTAVLEQLSQSAGQPPASRVAEHFDLIQTMTDADRAEQLVANIIDYSGDDEWLQIAGKTLQHGCPLTTAITVEQFRRGAKLGLGEVFQMEWMLAANCMASPNFAEGVRALLVDKDRAPNFEPKTLAEVTEQQVQAFFELPKGVQKNPLSDLR